MLEEHEQHELKIPVSIKIAFVIITIMFFAILIGFSWIVTDIQNVSDKNSILVAKNIELVANTRALTKENKARITDIQNSRLEGCKDIYEGIRKVFKPFFPPPPRSKKQQENLDKFNNTINSLQLECVKVVKPKNP